MRKLLGLTLITLALSTGAIAGDIPGNAIPPPPPPACTKNCTTSTATEEEGATIPIELVEIVASLLTLRP